MKVCEKNIRKKTAHRARGGGWAEEKGAEKTSTCAVSALLRTRNVQRVPQARVLDPTTKVGLQAPNSILAPCGYSIGSSKVSPSHETLQRFMTRM